MRTGAIFARGSCRALKWMALFGVVFALGGGETLAQTGTAVIEAQAHSYSKKIVVVNLDTNVWGTNVPASAFGITGNQVDSIMGLSTSSPGSDKFRVSFVSDVAVGNSLVYTPPGDTDRGLKMADGADAGTDPDPVATFTLSVTEEDNAPVLPVIPAITVNMATTYTAASPAGKLPAVTGGSGTGTITYVASPATPFGLVIETDPTSADFGKITGGPPNSIGTLQVTWTATDADPDGAEDVRRTFQLIVQAKPATPDKPTVESAASRSLRVSWSAPADNGSAITHYQVRYQGKGASGWLETATLDASAGTMATLTGLTNGTEYSVGVRALNGIGWSDYSASEKGTPAMPAVTAPGMPNVTATAGDGEVTLTWEAVTGATKYQYAHARTGSTMGAWMPEDGQSTMTATVTGLTNGMQYTFYVRAGNDAGYGEAGMDTETPMAAAVETPGAPTGLAAEAGDGQVTLSWTAPTSGATPTGYEFRSGVAARWSAWAATSSMIGQTVTDLDNGSEYTFEVRAVAGELKGVAASTTATPMAALTPPGAPTSLAAAPGNGQVTLSWAAPTSGGAPSGYQYRVIGGGVTGAWADTSSMTGQLVTNLTNGTEYTFEVRAVNAAGQGAAASTMATPMAAPASIPRGQITAMKMTTATSPAAEIPRGIEVDQIMVGGTNRYHVTEGDNGIWLGVTVRWSHKEIAEIHALPRPDRPQWVRVQIRDDRGLRHLPIPGVNWVSWIDHQGDADFPRTNTAGRLSGILEAWMSFTAPSVRADDYPGSDRHFKDDTSYIRVLLPVDQHEAENDAFYIQAIAGDVDLGATAAENLTTPVVIIEDIDPQNVRVSRKRGEPSVIYEGAPGPPAYPTAISSTVNGRALYTVTANPRRIDLPLEVRMDLLEPEGAVRTGRVSLSRSAVTLNPNMDGISNSEDVYLSLPYPDGDRIDNEYTLQASAVQYSLTSGGDENTQTPSSTPITVYDRHKIPVISMVNPKMASVAEGETVDVTVTVNRNPADTIAYDAELRQYTSEELKVTLSPERSEDYRIMTNPVTIKEHNGRSPWTQTATFTIEAITDDDVDMDTVTLDLEVAGAVAANGSETREEEAAVTVNITDETEKLVWAKTQDEVDAAVNAATSKAAGADGLNPGEMIEILGAELFGAAPGVVVDYAAASSDMTIATGSGSDRRMITVTPMAEGMAMVTVTATATPPSGATIVDQTKPNVAQIMFSVDVVLQDLTFTVMGPDDMNLAEGGMGGMVTVTTNRPVTENTEVMLMRDGSSSASDDDYTLEPSLVTIMAGHEMGSTMVMATEDNMAEDMEMLTLFLVVDGMQMTDKSVSFYLWDAAVPALPVIAQLLLAAFLAVGGYRRYRRR